MPTKKPVPVKELPKAIRRAISAGRCWTPLSVAELFPIRAGKVIGVQEITDELRSYVKQLKTDDRFLADKLLALVRALVDWLNWLAEAGKLGDAPRGDETFPMNYAPDVSKGASKWETAKTLYQKLGCGKDATIARIAGQVSYQDKWTEFAEIGVRAALLAKHKAAWVDDRLKTQK